MKESFFKYSYNKNLSWLSLILLICILIIIRGCSYPAISFNNNFLNKCVEIFFISSYEDKTFYNIAISYVAAYIFYIIQVYIPAFIDNKRSINLMECSMVKNINDIQILLLIIKTHTETYQNGLYQNNINHIYIIEENHKQIFKFTYLKTYIDLKEKIIAKNSQIMATPAFNRLDNKVIELFSSIPINELFVISDNIYNQKNVKTNTKIKHNDSIQKTEFIITQLSKKYGFMLEKYSATYVNELIHEYDLQSQKAIKFTNNELEIKVQLENQI